MRVLAYVVTIVVCTFLTVGAFLGLVLLGDGEPMWAFAVGAAGLTFALYGPLLLGSLAAWWRLRGGSDAGRHYRLWRIGATVGTVLGCVLVVVGGLASQVPVWFLTVVVVVSVALLLVAVPVGSWVRERADANGPRESDAWSPDTKQETRRVVRQAAITFGIAVVVTAVVGVFVTALDDDAADARLVLVLSPFPFLAAGAVCMLSSLRLNRRIREVTGKDFGRLRAVTRVVLKGKDDELDEGDRLAAARYAVLAPPLIGTQIGFIALLYTGLALQFFGQTLFGSLSSVLPIAMLGVMVVALAVVIPQSLIRARRARAYAAAHQDLLAVD